MKKLILLTIMILLSACTVEYEIIVDEEFNVFEKVTIPLDEKETYSRIYGYNNAEDFVDKMYYDLNEKASDTTYNITRNNKKIIIENQTKLEDLNNEITMETYEKFYSECKVTTCVIRARANKNTDSGDGTLPNYLIKIQVPYQVLKHNAREVDLKTNTYFWYYSVVEEKDDIEIIFEKEGKNIVEANETKKLIFIIIISIFSFILLIMILKFIYKIYKNGKPV